MVIVPDAGKRQQFFPIGDRHRPNIQLFPDNVGHLSAVFFIKAEAQNPFCGRRHFQRGGGKSRRVFFKHGPLVQQDTHK